MPWHNLLMSALFQSHLSYFSVILEKFTWILVFYVIFSVFMSKKYNFAVILSDKWVINLMTIVYIEVLPPPLKNTTPSFLPISPLNLLTVQAPLFRQPPSILYFHNPPALKNQIFQRTSQCYSCSSLNLSYIF